MKGIPSNKLNDLVTSVLSRVKESDLELAKGKSKTNWSSSSLYPWCILWGHSSYRESPWVHLLPNVTAPWHLTAKTDCWVLAITSVKLKSDSPCFAPFGGFQMLLLLLETGSSPQTPQQAGHAMLTMVVNNGLSFSLLQKALKRFDQMHHFQKCGRPDGM